MYKPPIVLQSDIDPLELRRLTGGEVVNQRDLAAGQLAELYGVQHPSELIQPDFEQRAAAFAERHIENGQWVWVYFPWSKTLVRTVNADDYWKLRTNRNRQIITAKEQQQLQQVNVGVVGLSIGAHFALSLVYSGIGKTLKLAEMDKLETSNLNRFPGTLLDIGKPKIQVIAQRIHEINPFQEINLYEQGLTEKDLDTFLVQGAKLDLIFEAVDDLAVKVQLRLAAKKHAVPLIMLTNLGDRLLIDVERYDKDAMLEPFHGRLSGLDRILAGQLSESEKRKVIIDIVGAEYIPTRALETLAGMYQVYAGRPQLYSTVAQAGGLAAYLARRVALNKDLKSGRYFFNVQHALNLQQDTDDGDRPALITSLGLASL